VIEEVKGDNAILYHKSIGLEGLVQDCYSIRRIEKRWCDKWIYCGDFHDLCLDTDYRRKLGPQSRKLQNTKKRNAIFQSTNVQGAKYTKSKST
jgi:hypothetical protein